MGPLSPVVLKLFLSHHLLGEIFQGLLLQDWNKTGFQKSCLYPQSHLFFVMHSSHVKSPWKHVLFVVSPRDESKLSEVKTWPKM